MVSYFSEEIFTRLRKELQRPLLILALLDEVSIELAEEVTGMDGIGAELLRLVEGNYFVRHLDRSDRIFGFHHLFQAFLRERALRELEPESVRELFRKAAAHSRARKRAAQALRYYLKTEDFEAMEKLLAEEGMTFFANNQTATLASILGKIPGEALEKARLVALLCRPGEHGQ
ncbi:MAG: hypothetical protein ACE5D4_01705 [Thermodesulfobacteriota bacterium]